MITELKSYLQNFSHLLFPHQCLGCGTDSLNDSDLLCPRCLAQLPETGFFNTAGNPVEKKFYGRIPVVHAASAYYFTKDSLMQHLIFQLKYHHRKDAGLYLGKTVGRLLQETERFKEVDILVPLPLNPKKEDIRGYNQAALICEGISEVWHKPVVQQAVIRTHFTESQTQRGRIGRWENMRDVFAVADAAAIKGKHVLLVDDIITTGATLEACGTVILQIKNTRLSLAAVANTV